MARPIKNNADYFPHDADMRNDPRVKALRRKFGLDGYAVYAMLLEFLTDSEYFEFKNDGLSMELIAGDFDVDPAHLTEILQYCFQLDLFQLDAKTNIIACRSLDNRLEPLLSKRKRDRIEVIDVDNTQSKGKESKGKKTKVEESIVNETPLDIFPLFIHFWEKYDKKIDRPKCEKKWAKIPQVEREKIMFHLEEYIRGTPDKAYRKNPATYLNNESWNNEIVKSNGTGNKHTEHSRGLAESFARRHGSTSD